MQNESNDAERGAHPTIMKLRSCSRAHHLIHAQHVSLMCFHIIFVFFCHILTIYDDGDVITFNTIAFGSHSFTKIY